MNTVTNIILLFCLLINIYECQWQEQEKMEVENILNVQTKANARM